jgi:heat shock protein HslJ
MSGAMMACIDGMETENAFLGTRRQAKKWRISGQQLELFDADGKMRSLRSKSRPPVLQSRGNDRHVSGRALS